MPFIFKPKDNHYPRLTELREFVARLVKEAVQWHITNQPTGFLAQSKVDIEGSTFNPQDSKENLDPNLVKNVYIYVTPDLLSPDNFGILDRSLNDTNKQYWLTCDINIQVDWTPEVVYLIEQIGLYLIQALCFNTNSLTQKILYSNILEEPNYSGKEYVSDLLANKLLSNSLDPQAGTFARKKLRILFNISEKLERI